MLKNNIVFSDKYFNSDSIEFGRVAKQFFKEFCDNYIEHNLEFFTQIKKDKDALAMPCLSCEGKNISSVSCAIDKITKVHLTEYTFPVDDGPNRRVDMWCRKTTKNIPYDFFIELKTHSFCTTTTTTKKETIERLIKLKEQIVSIKDNIKPNWGGNNVYLGIMMVYGYHNKNKEANKKSIENLKNDIIAKLDGYQILFDSWNIPEDVKTFVNKSEEYKINYDWILIAGIVLTRKK